MSLSFQERFKDRFSVVGKQGELEVTRSTPVRKDPLQQTGAAVMQTHHTPHPSMPFVDPTKSSAVDLQFARPIRVLQNRDSSKALESHSVHEYTPVSSNVESVFSSYASEVQSLDNYVQKERGDVRAQLRYGIGRKAGQLVVPTLAQSKALTQSTTHFRTAEKTVSEKKSLSANPSEKTLSHAVSHNPSLQASPTALSQKGSPEPTYYPYTLKDYRRIRHNKYIELGGLGPATVGSEDWLKRKELTDKRKSYGKQVLVTNASHQILEPRQRAEISPEEMTSNSRQRAMDFARRVKPPPAKFEKITVYLSDPEDARVGRHTNVLCM